MTGREGYGNWEWEYAQVLKHPETNVKLIAPTIAFNGRWFLIAYRNYEGYVFDTGLLDFETIEDGKGNIERVVTGDGYTDKNEKMKEFCLDHPNGIIDTEYFLQEETMDVESIPYFDGDFPWAEVGTYMRQNYKTGLQVAMPVQTYSYILVYNNYYGTVVGISNDSSSDAWSIAKSYMRANTEGIMTTEMLVNDAVDE